MTRSRFQGQVLGKTYTFTSEESQAHMKSTLEVVNKQLEEILAANPNLSHEEAAVLMALNAVSDQLKMQAAKEQ